MTYYGYRGYLIKTEPNERFGTRMIWIYFHSGEDWIPVGNSWKTIQDAKAFIREELQ